MVTWYVRGNPAATPSFGHKRANPKRRIAVLKKMTLFFDRSVRDPMDFGHNQIARGLASALETLPALIYAAANEPSSMAELVNGVKINLRWSSPFRAESSDLQYIQDADRVEGILSARVCAVSTGNVPNVSLKLTIHCFKRSSKKPFAEIMMYFNGYHGNVTQYVPMSA